MKVLLVATVKSHIVQFHRPLVSMLHEHGAEVYAAAYDNLAVKNGLKLDFVDGVYDIPFVRSPFSPKNIAAYRALKKVIDGGGFDVIHCNTPVGGIVGRLAARKAKKGGTKVLYTAHGFHFFKGGPKKSWLIYYPVEKLMARLTDRLITINEEDNRLAEEKFNTEVCRIHGVGVDTERYHEADGETRASLRAAEGLTDGDFAILCTGELNENKNQTTLLEAAAKLKESLPNLKVLLAGNGPLEGRLRERAASLGLEDTVRFLGYRTDLERVAPAVDIVVSCSRREGLPLNIVEAMLCGRAVVASENRGHRELVKDGKTGYILSPDDAESFAGAILRLANDKELRMRLGAEGKKFAQSYTVPNVKKELEEIYFADSEVKK